MIGSISCNDWEYQLQGSGVSVFSRSPYSFHAFFISPFTDIRCRFHLYRCGKGISSFKDGIGDPVQQFQGTSVSDSKDALRPYPVVDWQANPYKRNITGFGNIFPIRVSYQNLRAAFVYCIIQAVKVNSVQNNRFQFRPYLFEYLSDFLLQSPGFCFRWLLTPGSYRVPE